MGKPKKVGASAATITIRIPAALYWRLRIASVYTDKSMGELMCEFAEKCLPAMERRGAKKHPDWGRVSTYKPEWITRGKFNRGNTREGYVYLLRAETGHYKIGGSSNIDMRLQTFGIQLPFKVELVHAVEVPDKRKGERAAHLLFADKRVNGEWFALTDADVEQFCALTSKCLAASPHLPPPDTGAGEKE